ncbi:MAG: DUF5666 domain-containing protein, partial [Patescibacteria group bacterium]
MRILLIISLLISLTVTDHSFAQTKNIEDKIDDLKERVASRVAELNLVEKRGIVGVVTDVSGNEITLNDINTNTRFVDVDELTKFSSDEKDFGISDIQKGDELGVTGLYNKDSRRILARFVNKVSLHTLITGVVTEINSDDFSIIILSEDKKEFLVDVETLTRSFSYENGELVKSGFSKIKISENVVIFAFPDPNDGQRFTASKLFHFPDIPPNPNIPFVPAIIPQTTTVPST